MYDAGEVPLALSEAQRESLFEMSERVTQMIYTIPASELESALPVVIVRPASHLTKH